MSISLSEFVGTYTVSQGTVGIDPQPIEVGDTIVIGPVTALPSGTQAVPFAMYAPGATEPKLGPFNYVLVDASLWTTAVSRVGSAIPVFAAISLYKDPGGSDYKALYGVVTVGDPQQVGVFGAESGGA